MKRYVLAFAHMIPSDGANNLVLIERKKADWQQGKLNLPGGSVNDGELPEAAAFRELREETGIVAAKPDIKLLGSITGGSSGWWVDVCFCPYRRWFDGAEQAPRTLTDEGEIVSMPWRNAMHDPRLIPNLRIIIPFCQARAEGWQLNLGESDYEWTVGLAHATQGKSL